MRILLLLLLLLGLSNVPATAYEANASPGQFVILAQLHLSDNQMLFSDSGWGFREVEGIDPRSLRLFFLSLLWRAAATNRPEFSAVQIPQNDLKKLGSMLVAGDSEPLSFYPAQLTQLSTMGVVHNYAPLAQTKVIPAFEDQTERSIPIFRFYFDGLIAHVHRQSSDEGDTVRLGPLVVGGGSKLVVSTVTFEKSFQREDLEHAMDEAWQGWSELMAKL